MPRVRIAGVAAAARCPGRDARRRRRWRSEAIESLRHDRSRPPRPAATRTSRRPSRLAEPGDPEAARNVAFNAPEGSSATRNAIDPLHLVDFALTQCPPNSQAGLITIHANYEGDPDHLLGTAPLYDLEPGAKSRRRCFGFIVPTLEHPDHDPGDGADRRPTTACASPSPTSPS